MAEITVLPAEFTMVFFDASRIAALAEQAASDVGLPADLPVTVEVQEDSPLGRRTVESADPAHVSLESGAVEDPQNPRHLSESATAATLGRLLLRVRDLRSGDFDGAPSDDDLTLAEAVTWECHAAGRLSRSGDYPVQRQRWLYHFRTRHGFTDVADRAFARLWEADALTWAELTALSTEALAANPAA